MTSSRGARSPICRIGLAAKIEALRRVLRDEAVVPADQQALRLVRSLPHGHVAAALGMLRKLGLDRILSQGGRQPRREVALCIAVIVARLIDPASKLATARGLDDETATCSLGQVLKLGAVDEQELARACRQSRPTNATHGPCRCDSLPGVGGLELANVVLEMLGEFSSVTETFGDERLDACDLHWLRASIPSVYRVNRSMPLAYCIAEPIKAAHALVTWAAHPGKN